MTPEAVKKLIAEHDQERDKVITELQEEVEAQKTKFDGLVRFVNNFAKNNERKLNAVDSVAFAAFAMHGALADTFELNAENTKETRARMEKVLKKFDKFRNELLEEAKKRAENEAKAEAKKAKAKAAREARKGRSIKEVIKTDEQQPTDQSN